MSPSLYRRPWRGALRPRRIRVSNWPRLNRIGCQLSVIASPRSIDLPSYSLKNSPTVSALSLRWQLLQVPLEARRASSSHDDDKPGQRHHTGCLDQRAVWDMGAADLYMATCVLSRGTLDSASAWCSKRDDCSPWYQLDLGEVGKCCWCAFGLARGPRCLLSATIFRTGSGRLRFVDAPEAWIVANGSQGWQVRCIGVLCARSFRRELCRFRVELADSEDPRLESLGAAFIIWAVAGWTLDFG